MMPATHAETTAQRLEREHRERRARIDAVARKPSVAARRVADAGAAPPKMAAPRPLRRTVLTLADVIRTVADHFGVTVALLKSETRSKPIARPRQVACYLAREVLGKELAAIGRALGGRDHTTVIAAVKRIKLEITRDEKLASDVSVLRERLAAQAAAWANHSTTEETTSMQCDQHMRNGNGTDSDAG